MAWQRLNLRDIYESVYDIYDEKQTEGKKIRDVFSQE